MNITVALRIFSQELGDGLIYTTNSSLTSVPMYQYDQSVFKRRLRHVFDIRVPEYEILISSFTTVGSLLKWCIWHTYRTDTSTLDIEVEEQEAYSQTNFLNEPMLNIIITGRSGAGKSSFLNYLIDKDLFKTGEGSPVTSSYFEDFIYTSPTNGVVYHLFDTKGIEPTTTVECQEQVIGEIRKKDKSNNIYEWIHTVYYCFDASAKRIQPFEISFIKELMKESSVVILLTKKDLVRETDIAELKKQIIEDGIGTKIQVISVCSVAKQTRKGLSSCSGKEEVLKASFLGLWEKLSISYPQNLLRFLTKEDCTNPLNLEGVLRFQKLVRLPYELALRERIDKGLKKSCIVLSFDFLCDYPTLSELFLDTLYEEDRVDIGNLLNVTAEYLNRVSAILCRMNVEQLWATNETKHEQIFLFYKKLNKERPRIFYSHQSKEALEKLKEYGKNVAFSEVILHSYKVESALREVKNCFWIDGSEKDKAREVYHGYRDQVRRIGTDLRLLTSNFISAYCSELHQYGQYCLRNDDLEDMGQQQHSVFSEKDLNASEKIYYSTLQNFLKDHKITEVERTVLDSLRNSLNLLPERAGIIEDLVRTN